MRHATRRAVLGGSVALVALSVVAALGACGTSATGARPDDGGPDETKVAPEAAVPTDAAPVDACVEAGTAASTPLVQYLGGPVLSAPEIVTVTFPGDDATLVSRLRQFDETITSTPWWAQVTNEYCVPPGGSSCIGPGTSGGHVVLGAPAASSYTDSIRGGDSTVRQLLAASVQSGALPPPDAQTLYVVYFPAGTIVLLDGNSSCSLASFTSYHDTMTMTPADGGPPAIVNYVVVPRCATTEQGLTLAASHDIVEATTDPSPENAPAFQMTDPSWLTFGPEVADACEAVDTNLVVQESGFTVQRSWSNRSASAGHDPCVPVPGGETYFNVAPAGGSEELSLALGQSATIALFPVADGPIAPWQVTAVVGSGGSSALGLSLSQSTAAAGVPLWLRVTLQSKLPYGPDQLYGIVSQSGGDTHIWPMLVHSR